MLAGCIPLLFAQLQQLLQLELQMPICFAQPRQCLKVPYFCDSAAADHNIKPSLAQTAVIVLALPVARQALPINKLNIQASPMHNSGVAQVADGALRRTAPLDQFNAMACYLHTACPIQDLLNARLKVDGEWLAWHSSYCLSFCGSFMSFWGSYVSL